MIARDEIERSSLGVRLTYGCAVDGASTSVAQPTTVPAALRIWNGLKPSEASFWGDELNSLVPRLGLPGLETSLAVIEAHPNGLAALSTLESPRAAKLMASAFAGRPAQKVIARAWFDRFPEAAGVGLVPSALGTDRTDVARALDALRHLQRVHPDALAKALGHYDAPTREAIERLLSHGVELPSKRPTLPDLADPRRLPRPITPQGTTLSPDVHADFLRLLKITPLDGAPWIADLRSAFTPASLLNVARALFEAWTAGSAPPKERWMLYALAHFPDDAVAAELAQMAAELAPRGLSSRAQEMVEVLAAMQTRASLKCVHQLSRRVRSKAFRARAELAFTAAAEKMGLTEDELAERLVPDCGLTPEGVLPISPRIRLTMGKGDKAVFVGEDDKPVKALPKVDDEELAGELAELKKKASALLKEVTDRLERRMVNGRAMPLEHFTEVYLMHGLARRVAERFVWIQGETTFALGERGTLDARGQPFVPAEGIAVGVAHPLQLTPDAKLTWAKRLGDQPFDQLERRTLPIADVVGLRSAIAPHLNLTVPVGSVLKLEKLGWVRGEPIGRGCYVTYERRLPTGLVSVNFEPGIYLGDPMMHAEQVINGIDVNLRDPTPAMLLSEIEHDLHEALTGR